MKVAILFSGGKDSCQAVKYCLDKRWRIEALIAIKPTSGEAYLWHYPTVEWCVLSSAAMGIPLILLKSDKVGPKQEAEELRRVLERLKVDALVVGGVGLQKTQIREIRRVAKRFGVKILVPYQGYTSSQLLEEELRSGLDIIITDVAAQGLGPEWLGRKLDAASLGELTELSKRCGFDVLGEGGHYNTFVCDAPFFRKRIEFVNTAKMWDVRTSSGYLDVKDARLVSKG